MDARTAFVSTHLLLGSTSQLLSCSLSAALLNPPETLTDGRQQLGSPTSPASLIPSRSFRTSTISRAITPAATFTGAGAATVGAAGSGAGIGIVNPFLKQKLSSYAILGCALLEATGSFEPSPPPLGLSPESYLACMFLFLYLPRQPRETDWLRA
ncbi:unnamed protein product [Nyctereutes procyonoides]|uniref:(raccoon dog) hypothetical protein n=1 Tax=Nyctereutes procyonoides TaxID=34880 RepID=A0A811Y6C4_NYCPR|nr:unnamed protein product [Nyctereutes procyonoides]